MKYFIMVCVGGDNPAPLYEDEDSLEIAKLFDTEDEAEMEAQNNRTAVARGYEVYQWPW